MSEWLGLLRSLAIYWRPGRQPGLRAMYRPFVRAGDLVFDIGAHVGDRTVAFAALGARVVALEPQPALRSWLRLVAGVRSGIVVRGEAVGAVDGSARLAISSRTPTVSTVADDWRRDVTEANRGFDGVRWDRSAEVPMVTLDSLIGDHGEPAFCKLDIEGHEAQALAGLGRPLRALSVEFVAGALGVASACIDRLETLGGYEYNVIVGEARVFSFDRWVGADEAKAWIRSGADGVSSGDLYARRVEP